ncbi:hypothetical protein EVAR_86801_1 [Eumeta japonica]|uniref:Uncharacterized protein n=1 Tax=Eumeta variegata TaxID=151549 RepID=A0A4C1VT11_EUMVA|nr:hypothetical protein EVAR_86801_1 [Eumeta japonica]
MERVRVDQANQSSRKDLAQQVSLGNQVNLVSQGNRVNRDNQVNRDNRANRVNRDNQFNRDNQANRVNRDNQANRVTIVTSLKEKRMTVEMIKQQTVHRNQKNPKPVSPKKPSTSGQPRRPNIGAKRAT